ncbi:MAG TPA: hypothetical protein VIE43_03570 [Thermoanaerobaculia bacterium]|jgi:hypothetical protein|nr:hypothetical protein [Thermoanaerobaculia bacterium]
MKKNERKKLTLSRETVRSLEKSGLAAIQGALLPVSPVSSENVVCTDTRTCPTW